MMGEDMRQVFEAILPEQDIDRLCGQFGVIERQLLRVFEQARATRWGRYHPVAIDDTKGHRTSKKVWGTCTFHESSARSPNRAEIVRAHNWVVMGELTPGQPWTYLPHTARLVGDHIKVSSSDRRNRYSALVPPGTVARAAGATTLRQTATFLPLLVAGKEGPYDHPGGGDGSASIGTARL